MKDVSGHGRTVLFVSHNMSAILRLTYETIVLEKGRMVMRATRKYLSLSGQGHSYLG